MKRNKKTLIIGAVITLGVLFTVQPSVVGRPVSAEENSPYAIYASDTFSRSVTGGWGSAEQGGAYATAGGTDSNYSVDGTQGVTVVDATSSRQVWLDGISQQDQVAKVRVATDEAALRGNLEASIILRRVDSNNQYRFQVAFTPDGHVQAAIFSWVNGSPITLNSATTIWSHSPGAFYWIKAVAQGTNPTVLNMKVWRYGTLEPTSWTLSAVDSAPLLQTAASVGLHANTDGAASNLPVTFLWDDLTVGDSSAQEETPTPSELTATPTTPTSTEPTTTPTSTSTELTATPTSTATEPTTTPTPTATSTRVLDGLSWEAEDGQISPPFVVDSSGQYVSQPVETLDPMSGGRASYRFNISTPGSYVVKSVLNAPDTGSDSLFFNIDAEPTAPIMISDVPLTSGYQQRTLSWRGNGTWDHNQFVPKVFNLPVGIHELIIRGREAGLSLDKVSVEQYSISDTPTSTSTPVQVTNTPVSPTNTLIPTTETSPTATATSIAGVVWSADMETGDLSQWTAGGTHGGSYDSGDCIRPPGGVSTEYAHSGLYSMKLTIDTSYRESGCRQFRHEESLSGGAYYYSAWFYIPEDTSVAHFWNIFQFKSETDLLNDPFWVIDILNRSGGQMNLVLRWKGVVPGPHLGEGTALRYYYQSLMDVPVGQWFHVEAYLSQSSEYMGQLIVWQDGVELFNLDQVTTKYVGGDQRWSVNSYSDDLSPSYNSIYIDDAAVATRRIGP